MVIWKFSLQITDRQTVTMPKDANILSIQEQSGRLQMWAIVEPDAEREPRVIEVVGTGNPMADLTAEGLERFHMATVQTCQGLLVWHVFELLKSTEVVGSAVRVSSGLEILCPQKHWENMAKESRDQWSRRVLRPCPFCGGQGSQPNGKVFVNITHKPDCWILKRHEYYGGMTRVDEDDSAWNERAADSSANQFGGLESFNGDDLIMSATAYYLGRQTISVDAHCECLVRAWPRLSDNVREYIERIVENAFAKEACMAAMGKKISELGDACDRESWCKVRKCWTEKTSG